MKKNYISLVILTLLILNILNLSAGCKADPGSGRSLEITSMVQLWNVYSFNIFDAADNHIDDRYDLYIRRGRVGLKGDLHKDVSYYVNFAFDNIGKEKWTASTGTPQDQPNLNFFLWDGFFTWHLEPNLANITLGYFRPQAGRESILTAFKVISFTKALTNSYTREHYVGRSNGRETGINLGGMTGLGILNLVYNFGIFDSNYDKITGNGKKWSPLVTSRLSLMIGDPESSKYTMNYKENYYGKRTGITLSGNFTSQGPTNETVNEDNKYTGGFYHNGMYGFDLLANWNYLTFSAEAEWLNRSFTDGFAKSAAIAHEYTDFVWFVRAGWSIPFKNGSYLEPCFMLSEFKGSKNSVSYPGGYDRILDVGLNWYLDNTDMLINLHYAAQNGSPVSKYSRDGSKKGDFIGLGIQFVY